MGQRLRYLEIRMYEGERIGWFGAPWYQQLVKELWQAGVPGVTVTRAESGLDRRGNVQNIHSEYVSDNLPIVIECVASDEEVLQISNRIQALAPKRLESWVTTAYDAKQLDKRTADIMSDYVILKVYMKESDQVNGEPLALSLMNRLADMGVNWVHVTTALEGYGKDQVLRKNHNFSLTNKAPMVLEAVLSKEPQQGLLTDLKPLFDRASGPAIVIQGESI
ncbi:DUF190 domain-containing protein [Alicyclobacillus curvatus]|jgi:PII-like signaling protein|nr:DUF190 domain-containing protein [Alicyclobacillus curvatus]